LVVLQSKTANLLVVGLKTAGLRDHTYCWACQEVKRSLNERSVDSGNTPLPKVALNLNRGVPSLGPKATEWLRG